MKKKRLPRGFFTIKGEPTQNSVEMYRVYIRNLPKNWNIKRLHHPSLIKVREHFNVDYGFKAMIMCGLIDEWKRSQSALGRCVAMTKAYNQAVSEMAVGIVMSYVKIAA